MADEIEGGVAAPVAATEAPTSDAPWAADLRGLGLDDETFTKVDGYMREKVQPHTTQLEQQLADQPDIPEGVQQFWADLQEDPGSALTQLGSEVFSDNPEAADIFKVAIKYAEGNPDVDTDSVLEAAAQHAEEGGTADEFEVELDPDDREKLDFVENLQAEHEDAEYRETLSALKEANPDDFPQDWGEDQLVEVLSPLVIAAPEDLDDEAAIAWAHERYKATAALIHGTPGSEVAAAEAAGGLSEAQVAAINSGAAPPVMTGGQNASVPAEKQYDSIGDAVKDFGRELAAKNQQAPPIA